MENDDINDESLNESLVYLNKAGNKLFFKNLLDFLKNYNFSTCTLTRLNMTNFSNNVHIKNNCLKATQICVICVDCV